MIYSTYRKSCQRRAFPGNWSHWYWQTISRQARKNTN